MAGVEVFIVLPVRALDLAIVARRKRFDLLVFYAEFSQLFFKYGQVILFCAASESFGKFESIVSLNTLNGERKVFKHMLQK